MVEGDGISILRKADGSVILICIMKDGRLESPKMRYIACLTGFQASFFIA